MSYGYGFAPFYDRLCSDIDYAAWCEYIKSIFSLYHFKPVSVLDLACGTGGITTLLAKDGFDMTGLDLSEEMLSVAFDKAKKEDLDILYLNQDMCEFELYGSIDAVVCCLDGINYITDKRRLQKCFKTVQYYLNPGGLFVFDINTAHKLKDILKDNTFIYDYGDLYCIWQNEYDKKKKQCLFDITVFYEEAGGFSRFDEQQAERAYEVDEITQLLLKAGFINVRCFDAFSLQKPKRLSERVVFCAQKKC